VLLSRPFDATAYPTTHLLTPLFFSHNHTRDPPSPPTIQLTLPAGLHLRNRRHTMPASRAKVGKHGTPSTGSLSGNVSRCTLTHHPPFNPAIPRYNTFAKDPPVSSRHASGPLLQPIRHAANLPPQSLSQYPKMNRAMYESIRRTKHGSWYDMRPALRHGGFLETAAGYQRCK